MHIDCNSIEQNLNLQNDIVILGGGISGIFLAYLLKDIKKNIVILDHGSIPNLEENIKYKNDILQTGIHHEGILISNKTVGGWSNLWGGLLTELSKIDLEKKYWGINYEELNNLYKEIYSIFHIKACKDPIVQEFRNKKKINHLNMDHLERYFVYYLKELNFFLGFNNFLKTSNNIKFFYNANITNVIQENNKISNVDISNTRKKKISFSSKYFILSMGVKGNNQFLLSLQNKIINNPLAHNNYIGRYFHDHLGLDMGNVEITDIKKFCFLFENGFYKNIKYQPKIKNISKECEDLAISGQFEDRSNFNDNIMKIKHSIKSMFFQKNLIAYKNFIRIIFSKKLFQFADYSMHFILQRRIKNFFGNNTQFRVQSEQSVSYDSNISLDREDKNANNFLKKIQLNWIVNSNDFKKIKLFTNNVNDFLLKNNIGRIITYQNLDDNFFYKNLQSTYHLSGGTIISKDNQTGVCDKDYKVWGFDNLYVTGSSLFPNNGSANTTLTILALVLKLSKNLKSLIK
jgi:hypothetical protein